MPRPIVSLALLVLAPLYAGAAMPAALDRLAEAERQRAREVRKAFPAEWRRFERSVARGRIATTT